MTSLRHDIERSPGRLAPWFILPVLISGTLKAAGMGHIAGLDITGLGLALLLLVSTLTVISLRAYPAVAMTPFLCFTLVIAVSALAMTSSEYGALKTRDYFLVTVPAVFAAAAVVQARGQIQTMNKVWLLTGTIASVLAWRTGGAEDLYGRLGIGDSTLGPAYLMAAALVVAAGLAGDHKAPLQLAIPFSVYLLITLVAVGSRGPVLAAFAGGTVWLLLGQLSWRRTAIPLTFVGGLTAGILLAPEVSARRILLAESEARINAWGPVWTSFNRNPVFGIGWGNYTEIGSMNYPHNLVGELMSELGVIGLLAFTVVLSLAVKNAWVWRNFPPARIAASVAAVAFVGQQFSSDLTNRVFWLALVPLIVLPPTRGRVLQESSDTRSRTVTHLGDRHDAKQLEN